MSEPTSEPVNAREFRRQLDDVLRQRNSAALRDFLISAGQWDEDNTPADIDRAMWMMIAGSAALTDLHDEARRWLVDHGFMQEAQAILGRASGRGASQRPRGGAGSRPTSGQRAGPRQGPPRPRGNQPREKGRRDASSNSRGNGRDGGSGPPARENRRPSDGQGGKP